MKRDLSERCGLPISLDTDTGTLSFKQSVTSTISKTKHIADMKQLWAANNCAVSTDDSAISYYSYPDIYVNADLEQLRSYDMLYGITVILPGTHHEEFKKTSGHYHGDIPGIGIPYPEIYEVLSGHACFVLQKENAVHLVQATAGQAIIIPPYYYHCSINIGDEPLAFSNIAAGSCPLIYEHVRSMHGLGVYVHKTAQTSSHQDQKQIVMIGWRQNPNYIEPLTVSVEHAMEHRELGITFGKPIYSEFMKNPATFDYLLHPDETIVTLKTGTVDSV